MTPRETVRLTADVVLFAHLDGQRHVLLIQRGRQPYQGYWALPGGHVDPGETTIAAARRELTEETGLSVPALAKVRVYSTPGRDPRGRYVAAVYTADLGAVDRYEVVAPTAGDDAAEVCWVPVAEVLTGDRWPLAFDHRRIITETQLTHSVGAVTPAMADLGRTMRAGLASAFPAETEQVRQVLAMAEESGEFVQAARRWLGLARTPGDFGAVEAELADVIITSYVTAAVFGIDIDRVITETAARIIARGWRTAPAGDSRS
jgi:8-oxo-dGTP diphosphatase